MTTQVNKISTITNNSYEAFTQSLPENYRKDVIANVWLKERGDYEFLAGRIIRISENSYWGKTAHIHFYKINRTIAVKWSNVYTRDAIIEIRYGNEFYVGVIDQIDSVTMEITDEFGENVWVNISTIVQVLCHQSLAEDYVRRQIALAEMSA